MFAWNVYGLPGTVGLALGWAMAWLVYQAAPSKPQNRRLAVMLLFESIGIGVGGGVMYLATTREDAFGWQAVMWATVPFLVVAYLGVVALLETPLARPLRSGWVRAALYVVAAAASLSVVARPELVIAGIVQLPTGDYESVLTPLSASAFFGLLMPMYLYGLAAALHAYVRAPRGSSTRRKAGWFALAFGVKDVAGLTLATLLTINPDPVTLHATSVAMGAGGLILFVLLLSYALLREQVLDIELHLKWTLRRSTVAAFFVATFFTTSELAQQFLGERAGSAYVGTAAAGLLVFALAPLQRAADRIANAAMPRVQDTEEYRTVRKREVYRAAVESTLEDGDVTEKERALLATFAQQLGLGPKDALDIERDARRARLRSHAAAT